MNIRKITSVALLTFAGLALTACGGPADDAGGPVTLRIDEIGYGSTVSDAEVIKTELDTKLEISLEVNAPSTGSDYYNQLATALAAGDAPDLFQVDRTHLTQLAGQGLLLDLNPYLNDEHLADYLKIVEPETLSVATLNDKVYALPKRATGYRNVTYWIRQDWLDKLGLKAPTNTDEFLAVARAFTERDPDGNGKKDTYGLTGTADTAWEPLWAAFGSGGPGSFYFKDGQLIHGMDDPGTLEALRYFNSLVAAGVVDPDFATNQNRQDHERAMQGIAGIIPMDWPNMTKPDIVDKYKEVQPDAEWVQIAPPAGPAGSGAQRYDRHNTPTLAIPATLAGNDAKLAKIFELMNYVSTEEGNRLVCYGIQDTHYKLDGDDVTMTDKGKAEGSSFWLYQFSGRNEAEYLAAKFSYAKKEFEFAMNQPTLPVFDGLVTPPEGYQSSDADTYSSEQLARFISGEKALDEWDAFRQTLKNDLGYQQYIDAGLTQLKQLNVTPDPAR